MTVSLKKRDYKQFGPIAKVRFRPMCEALGFEQTSPTVYHRQRKDWFDYILLETSRWGGNGFDIHYGIWREPSEGRFYSGLSGKLKRRPGKPTAWNRFTKADVEASAAEAHDIFVEQAEPFLNSFQSRRDIGLAYLDSVASDIERMQVGASHRNPAFIELVVDILTWAGLDSDAEKVRNGTFRKENKIAFFRKWFSKS